MPRKKTVPKYSHHKGTGQAKVRIDGKDHYLGVFGSAESKQRYAEVISQWQNCLAAPPVSVTVAQLTLLYLNYAKQHYRKHGKQTSEVHIIRQALKRLNRVAAKMPASDLSPRVIKKARELMIGDDLARSTINKIVGRIRRMVKWAVGEEILHPNVLVALQAVPDLKRGRSEAKETGRVTPVPDAHIDAIRDELPAAVWAMVSLQRYTGMRPGEVRIMRACDIDMSGTQWSYTPSTHKTEHHDQERVVAIGPRGQEIIKQWITLDTHAYLFHSGQGEPYERSSYRNAIVRACQRAGIPQWSPNRLRHNFATDARREFGIEPTRGALGHNNLRTSELYAEKDLQMAHQIVARIG